MQSGRRGIRRLPLKPLNSRTYHYNCNPSIRNQNQDYLLPPSNLMTRHKGGLQLPLPMQLPLSIYVPSNWTPWRHLTVKMAKKSQDALHLISIFQTSHKCIWYNLIHIQDLNCKGVWEKYSFLLSSLCNIRRYTRTRSRWMKSVNWLFLQHLLIKSFLSYCVNMSDLQ